MVQNILFVVIILIILYLRHSNYFVSISYFLGIDLISYGLIFLRVWICALIIISRELVNKNNLYRSYFLFLILFLLFILYLTFSSVNLFLFYVFFERSLIPTLLLILG
jgi:NADH-ubiquinone oxidoreductase chain 4